MAVSAAGGLTNRALIARLADGRLHSGVQLAAELGISRAAVWKGVERLRAGGIEIQALARRGYRLPAAVELLDATRIAAELGAPRRQELRTLEVLFAADSTNTHLISREPPPYGRADVCLCELQRAGRGRRGRHWIAPFGAGLAISVGWTFRDAIRGLPALSLAVGVAVSRALLGIGARGIGLKWPNDICFDDRKIGGVLIDLRAEADGPAFVVIGIGINMSLSAEQRAALAAAGAQAAALDEACAAAPSRNRAAGAILDELLRMLTEFGRDGFAPFRGSWTALDVLRGRRAEVVVGSRRIVGTAQGIDRDGALQLDVGGSMQRFVSADVSLRAAGGAV
ncbi:MAG TPA: biotin--[acetyl-CoA-carboxylase] ligase [Steroidobacteraceae bacterium]|nr:biotin--[acetyl-CoA-carboxylase] ligase [Steroidobacteraceae bacterium]